MNHLLEMKNLSIELYRGKNKPPVKLVNEVDLTIDKKQTFGIVGESGCGKSITSASIMGLLSFPLSVTKESSIRFQQDNGNELEILRLTRKELCKIRGKEISMIFQEPMTALDPMYTIGEQISESLKFHTNLTKSEMYEKSLEMLDKVKISRAKQILADYPHHLSGGMLQRVMIAIALINTPRLLIADEPTTALDVTIQAQILNLLNELRESFDTSVIMITHDLGVIAETCEQVAVLYGGQVVEQASVVDIFHATAHPYTKGLLRSVTSLGGADKNLYTIKGTVPTAGTLVKGCLFAERCEYTLPICLEKNPPLTTISSGHQCRCWLNSNLEKTEVLG